MTPLSAYQLNPKMPFASLQASSEFESKMALA